MGFFKSVTKAFTPAIRTVAQVASLPAHVAAKIPIIGPQISKSLGPMSVVLSAAQSAKPLQAAVHSIREQVYSAAQTLPSILPKTVNPLFKAGVAIAAERIRSPEFAEATDYAMDVVDTISPVGRSEFQAMEAFTESLDESDMDEEECVCE